MGSRAFRLWFSAVQRFLFFHKRLVLLSLLAAVLIIHLARSQDPVVSVAHYSAQQPSNSKSSQQLAYDDDDAVNKGSRWFGLSGIPGISNIAAGLSGMPPKEEPKKSGSLVTIAEAETNKHYVALLRKYGADLIKQPLVEKCQLYVEEIYSQSPSWKVEKYADITQQNFIRKVIQDRESWVGEKLMEVNHQRMAEYKKEHPEAADEQRDAWYLDSDRDRIEAESYRIYEKLTKVDNALINYIRDLVVYSTCFNHDADSSNYRTLLGLPTIQAEPLKKGSDESFHSRFADVELRLFPYLTRKLPYFVRWTGEKFVGFPNMAKYTTAESHRLDQNVDIGALNRDSFKIEDHSDKNRYDVDINKAFFNHLKHAVNGKGIVMSSADEFIQDTLSLIRTLRAVGNTMPVQIVHRGDLSLENQLKLVQEARKDDVFRPRAEFEKLRGMTDVKIKYPYFNQSFVKQELWFVNVDRCVTEEFKPTFRSFINKLLAYVFNSFDEILLVDSDIVVYNDPQKFFETSQYKKSNTLYFKDRTHDEKLYPADIAFFTKMMPHDVDNVMFNLAKPTEKTFGNRYMKQRFKHLMESGVVAQKRTDYWDGMLVALQLSTWRPVLERVWGDKELFWLSQSIAGKETYEFNENHVAAVGELTDPSVRQGLKAKEICATHPGHISSDDGSLLWINSGIETCKRSETFEDDHEDQIKLYGFANKDEVKKYYESTLRITDAIIPPDSGMYAMENTLGEPERGWKMSRYCSGYFWCAYDSIGGSSAPEHQGTHFHFSDSAVLWHNYISKVYRGKDI